MILVKEFYLLTKKMVFDEHINIEFSEFAFKASLMKKG